VPVNVRQSMANGGGPACLRLRVVADPGTIDPRFMATQDKLDAVERVIAARWPEQIAPGELADPGLAERIRSARSALLAILDLEQLD
jgi:succinylarginine dihydrolase